MLLLEPDSWMRLARRPPSYHCAMFRNDLCFFMATQARGANECSHDRDYFACLTTNKNYRFAEWPPPFSIVHFRKLARSVIRLRQGLHQTAKALYHKPYLSSGRRAWSSPSSQLFLREIALIHNTDRETVIDWH